MNHDNFNDITSKQRSTLTPVIIALMVLFVFCLLCVILEPMFGKYVTSTSADPQDARVAKWAVSEDLKSETIKVTQEPESGSYMFHLTNTDSSNADAVNEVLTKFWVVLDCSQLSEAKKIPSNVNIYLEYKDSTVTSYTTATKVKDADKDIYTFTENSESGHDKDFYFQPGEKVALQKDFRLKFTIANTNEPYELGEVFENLIIKVYFEQAQ